MTSIPRYTIAATAIVAVPNEAGKPVYIAKDSPASITPDSQGKWCLVEDHIESLVRQGDELALLRLEVIERDKHIEDLIIEINILSSIIDDLEQEL